MDDRIKYALRLAREMGGSADDEDRSRFIREQLDSGEPQMRQYVEEADFPSRASRAVEAADRMAGTVNDLAAKAMYVDAMQSPKGRSAAEIVTAPIPPDPNEVVKQAMEQYRAGDQLGGFETMLAGMPQTGALRAYHYSPQPIEKFEAGHAGTGAGGASFGVGHYFGEKENDARMWQDRVNAERGLPRGSGHMHEVELDVDPERMIDYNKHLHEQPEFVRDAFLNKLNHDTPSWFQPPAEGASVSGKPRGDMIVPLSEGAMNAMREAGIQGVRYYDPNNSYRGYVTFSGEPVSVLRRYADGGDVKNALRLASKAGGTVKSKSHAPYGVIDLGDKIIVGAPHGKTIDLSDDLKQRIRDVANKHGAWYEGAGGDIEPNKDLIPKYSGSWDDRHAKSVEGYPIEYLGGMFSNVDVNKPHEKFVDPNRSIGESLIVNQDKMKYFKDRSYDEKTLNNFLSQGSQDDVDLLSMAQMPATKENLQKFFTTGERLTWPENWQEYPNKLGKIAKKIEDQRNQFLLNAPPGVYVTGAGHIPELQSLRNDLQVIGGERAAYADGGMVERKEWNPFPGLKIKPPAEKLSSEPDIREYQLKRRAYEFEGAPEPTAPTRKVVVNAPLLGGKKELGELPYYFADPATKALNAAYGLKTAPLYASEIGAPLARALDAYETAKKIEEEPSSVSSYTAFPKLFRGAGPIGLGAAGVGAAAAMDEDEERRKGGRVNTKIDRDSDWDMSLRRGGRAEDKTMGYKDKQIADALRVAKRKMAATPKEPAPYFDPNAPRRLKNGVLDPNMDDPSYGDEVKRWRGERGSYGRDKSYDPWADPENMYTHSTEERHAPDDPLYHVYPEEYQRGALGRKVFALKDGGHVDIRNALRLALGGRAELAYGGPSTDAYINSLYQNVLGRQADPEGQSFWQQKLNEGAINPTDVLHSFAQSPEFQNLYKTNPSQAVNALYQTALGRTPDPEGLAFWSQQAQRGLDPGQVVSGFTGSEEGSNIQALNDLYEYYAGDMPTTQQLQEGLAALSDPNPFYQYINKAFPSPTPESLFEQEARRTNVQSDAPQFSLSVFNPAARRDIEYYQSHMGNFNPKDGFISPKTTNWQNAEILKSSLDKLGLPKQGLYSLLGNFIVESAGLEPNRVEGIRKGTTKKDKEFQSERKALSDKLKSDDWKNVDLQKLGNHKLGLGLAQWSNGRAVDLINFAIQQGKDWWDMGLQSDFLRSELEGPYKQVVDYYRNNPNSGKEGVAVFQRIFENPKREAGKQSANSRYSASVAASQYFDDPEAFGNFEVSPLIVEAKQTQNVDKPTPVDPNLPKTTTPTTTPTPMTPTSGVPGMSEYDKALVDYRQKLAEWQKGVDANPAFAPFLQSTKPQPPDPSKFGNPSGGNYVPPLTPAPDLSNPYGSTFNPAASTAVPGGGAYNPMGNIGIGLGLGSLGSSTAAYHPTSGATNSPSQEGYYTYETKTIQVPHTTYTYPSGNNVSNTVAGSGATPLPGGGINVGGKPVAHTTYTTQTVQVPTFHAGPNPNTDPFGAASYNTFGGSTSTAQSSDPFAGIFGGGTSTAQSSDFFSNPFDVFSAPSYNDFGAWRGAGTPAYNEKMQGNRDWDFSLLGSAKGGAITEDRHVKEALRIARASGGRSPAWTRKEGQNPEGGLNAKGRASAKAEGSNLKPPAPDPKTDKDAARRKSFCARMKGMKSKLTSSETANDPDSRINKSLRAWNCREYGGVVDDALRIAKGGEVWDKPRPKSLGEPEALSKRQKRSAKAAAKAAGRPWPNLVDNMRAAQRKK